GRIRRRRDRDRHTGRPRRAQPEERRRREPVHQCVYRGRRCALSACARRGCSDRKRATPAFLGLSQLRGARPRGPSLALPQHARAVRALRSRDFRAFFGAQTISQIATWMHWVAQAWLILSLTNSPLLLGLINLLHWGPILLLAIPSGAIADRVVKRRLLMVTQAGQACTALAHALPEVAEHLYPEGRPRTPEETATWLQYTLASYEQLALGYLAVVRKKDGALIGRCGLMDLVVESAASEHGIRRGWFGREGAPAGVALTFECELGYTFDPAVWGQGFATEASRCVR